MTLGPTRQLLQTGQRLLQLSQQLQASTRLDGLARAYAGLTIDPLTRLDAQLQGVAMAETNDLQAFSVPPGSPGAELSPLRPNPPMDASWPGDYPMAQTSSRSPGHPQSSFSHSFQPEGNHPSPSSQPHVTGRIHPQPLSDSIDASSSAIDLTPASMHQDPDPARTRASLSLATNPALNAPVPEPHPLFSSSHSLEVLQQGSLPPSSLQPHPAPSIPGALPKSLPGTVSIASPSSASPSPLRMVQSTNKLASILQTQLAPPPTTASIEPPSATPTAPSPLSPAPLLPVPQTLPTTNVHPQSIHRPLVNDSSHPPITLNQSTQSTTEIPQTTQAPEPPIPYPSLDPLTLDTLLDAVAERLEFDRLRLYGTSSP